MDIVSELFGACAAITELLEISTLGGGGGGGGASTAIPPGTPPVTPPTTPPTTRPDGRPIAVEGPRPFTAGVADGTSVTRISSVLEADAFNGCFKRSVEP